MTEREKAALAALRDWYAALTAWERRPVGISAQDQIALYARCREAYEALCRACDAAWQDDTSSASTR